MLNGIQKWFGIYNKRALEYTVEQELKCINKMAGSLSWQRCSTVHPASLAKHPQTWTKEEIAVWLRWCSEEYSIEAIPPEKFDLNGKALCLLSRSDFMERIPRNGDVLYNCLQSLVAKHAGSGVVFQHGSASASGAQDIYQSFGGDHRPANPPFASSSDPMSTAGFLLVPSSSPMVPPPSVPITTVPCTVPRSSFVPIKPHTYISIPVQHPQDSLFAGPSSVTEQPSPGNGHSLDSLRQDRSSDCRLLWEFIYQLLSNKKYSNYVCWEDKEEYVFRIINPTGLAELWGQQKNRTNMTYEKLSRALRYYYRMNIIKKVQGKRLTYRFLQPPSCIQKGQRGAKPHYKLKMGITMGSDSQQSSQKDEHLRGASSVLVEHVTSTKEESKSVEDYEAESEQDYDFDSPMSELGHDSANGRSSGSSRLSPARRMSLDIEQQLEKHECPTGPVSQTNYPLASPIRTGTSFSSLTSLPRGMTHSPYLPMSSFSEERYVPSVTNETFYASPRALSRNTHLPSPRQSGSSQRTNVRLEADRRETLDMEHFERRIRYQESIYRSLSSDFAQSLQVQPFAFRPNQPRSTSPRCDVQEEPEDLSTRKVNRPHDSSTNVSFRTYTCATASCSETVSNINFTDISTTRDKTESISSSSRIGAELNISVSPERTESNTPFSRERKRSEKDLSVCSDDSS